MAEARPSIHYFAYGSNMDPDRMRERGVPFSSRMPARLPGRRLVFNKIAARQPRGIGYANVVPDPGSHVEGALYTIGAGDLKALDSREGYPSHYRRERVGVTLADGSRRDAFIYVAHPRRTRPGLRPTLEYLQHLLAGGDVLSPDYFHRLREIPVFTVAKGEHRPAGGQRERGRRPRGIARRRRAARTARESGGRKKKGR